MTEINTCCETKCLCPLWLTANRQQLVLAQSRALCLTGCLKYDSRVKRMIKLLIVSWVQVFITFMLAYFWAAYSKNDLYCVWWLSSDTVHTECGLALSAQCWCDGGVAHSHGSRRVNEGRARLTLAEDYSNNYAAVLVSCLVSFTWTTTTKKLSDFERKKCKDVFPVSKKGLNEILMRITEMCGSGRCR